jgi:PAS domain S-box-containing protein
MSDVSSDADLLGLSAMGIVGIDTTGTIQTFSRGAERIFGYEDHKVIGQPVSMLMPESLHSALDSSLDVLGRTGEVEIIGSGRHLQARHADGTIFGVRLTADRMSVDGQTMFVGIVMDRRLLGDTRYWLDEFFNLTLELLAVATFDGMFIRLNPAWHTTLGYPMSELLSRPYMDFVHPDYKASTEAAMETLANGDQVVSFENQYLAADGSYRTLEWTAKPLLERGIIMASAHDVTRRHIVEAKLRATRDRADEASKYKSEFLSRMSHELRTPLNSIIGFAQLMQMDELNPDQHENMDAIQRSGRHLLSMINEVLDIVQIESGRLRLSLEPVSVAEELHVAFDLIGPQATQNGISIASRCEDDVFVLADRQRLLQIFLNLLSNAVKYNRRDGSISVEVQASGGTVTIAVTDTGIGIDHSKLSALFRPFERLGAEATSVEGTGVGLALSRTLSREMHGTLTVSSTTGEGSTFCLELPRAVVVDVVPDQVVSSPEYPSTVAVSGRPITVLYIEDNITNSQLMDRALRTQGEIELVMAVQGSLGLDLAKRLKPDLVLLDLHLPDISGEEVLQQIRQTPSIADTVVVVCSADASPGQTRRLMDAGANGYLTKPVDLSDLFEIVRRVREYETLEFPRRDEH